MLLDQFTLDERLRAALWRLVHRVLRLDVLFLSLQAERMKSNIRDRLIFLLPLLASAIFSNSCQSLVPSVPRATAPPVVNFTSVKAPASVAVSATSSPALGLRSLQVARSEINEARVENLLSLMTLDEKISFLTGNGGHGTPLSDDEMSIGGVPRLNLRAMRMADGPVGVRWLLGPPATAFPSGLTLASSFDRELASKIGETIATEVLAKGRDLLLGPCTSIARNPLGGRNFECYGEDPFLVGEMGAAFIRGAEGRGVATCVKHVIGNDQETNRETQNSEVSERALREIYLAPVFTSLQAGSKVVMASFNRLNGRFVTSHRELLTEVLKKEWGFSGFVISDWGATHETVSAFNAGLDLEMNGLDAVMPGGVFFSRENLLPQFESGAISQEDLNDKVRRILRVMVSTGTIDRKFSGRPPIDVVGSPGHLQLAADAEVEGAVLLKNDGLLPLVDLSQSHIINKAIRTVAVIGPFASEAVVSGGGSSMVTPRHKVSIVEGFQNLLSTSDFKKRNIKVVWNDGRDLKLATRMASRADAVIVVVGYELNAESEGQDRHSLGLPPSQDALISALAHANPQTAVVINSGGGISMPWLSQVKSVVQAWYGGQEVGTAIARLIFGKSNFSGKLPISFYKDESDSSSYKSFPGTAETVTYEEGVFVGYRQLDTQKIAPLFPFGFGKSYTNFKFSNLKIANLKHLTREPRVRVSFKITNTGFFSGAEVAQVYLHERMAAVARPEQELKAFKRVQLAPGESTRVELLLKEDAFQYWDEDHHRWNIDAGSFDIRVGNSSRDLPLHGAISLLN